MLDTTPPSYPVSSTVVGLMSYFFCLGLKDLSLFSPCFIAEVTNTQRSSHSSYSVQMPEQLSGQADLCPCSTGVCLG